MERKLATVLFVDLVDSTGLVSGADPEVARGRVTGFLDHVSTCVEAHGGTVGRYAGDAIMAAFGIPQAHEDDAVRAVRAALAIVGEVGELGLQARIGIEAGEIVSDESDLTLATGEAINVAVRLQQTAEPGEVLIGPGAHRLTLGAVEAEDLGPRELKGLEQPVWVRCAVSAGELSQQERAGVPLIGRGEELELLENTFARVSRDRRAHLFTLYGEPGVGKSRLAREFLAGLEGATILSGRALPYGEGVTYWPVAEMVKVAAGISDDDPVKEAMGKLRACCEDEAVADLLALAAGVLEAVEGDRSRQELQWAVREWAEQLGDVQPLVLVFEDIHWAEEPLLELIEHLATWVKEAPLLIVCLARPELLDIHPAWGGGRVRATSIELEPLGPAQTEQMIRSLLDEIPEVELAGLIEKTGGNPLFVEETTRMLAEQDGSAVVEGIPDTVQALIAARIDRLPPGEKALLQRAAVIGRTFWMGAVDHISPDLDDLEPALESLEVKDFLVRESRSSITGESAYKFKHVLIREVAYGGLSKSDRAEHHLRFAAWLRERVGDELLEIRAYHLDHAAALLQELKGETPAELAWEAAAALEEAGRRAMAQEANRAARRFLLRALELEPTLERRYQAARAAWRITDYPVVAREMDDVRAEAEAAGETAIQGRALIALAEAAVVREADLPRAEALVEQALEVAEESGGKAALGRAFRYLGQLHLHRGELDEAEAALERARGDLAEAGAAWALGRTLNYLAWIAWRKGDPDRAEQIFRESIRVLVSLEDRATLCETQRSLAQLLAERGRLAEAERLALEARQTVGPQDLPSLATTAMALGQVRAAQGRDEEAEALLREAHETIAGTDLRRNQTETLDALAQFLRDRGRADEAADVEGRREELVAAARSTAPI